MSSVWNVKNQNREKAMSFIHAILHPTGDDDFQQKKCLYRDQALADMEKLDQIYQAVNEWQNTPWPWSQEATSTLIHSILEVLGDEA